MNMAFIDGQNLHLGTTRCIHCSKEKRIQMKSITFADCICGNAWKIDYLKFRKYLSTRYKIKTAYYFIGYFDEHNQKLYSNLEAAGFLLIFKQHNKNMLGKKSGNVDIDIVFEVMKLLIKSKQNIRFLLVSGDGDYKKLVDFLIQENKFIKILFPGGDGYSSLYNNTSSKLKDSLGRQTTRRLIEKLNK